MSNRRELLGRMRDTLADLYDDQRSATRVADDAGLDPARIERADRAINLWYSILREADRQGKVDELLALAVKEYPGRVELEELRAEYDRLSAVREPLTQSGTKATGGVQRPALLLWAAMGVLAVALLAVLVASRGALGGARTAGAALPSTTLAPTDSPPEEAAVVPSAEPATARASTAAAVTAPQVELPGCFAQYFRDVPQARVIQLEPGVTDFVLRWVDLKEAEPIGFIFTIDGQPLGAMKFRYIKINRFYRIASVVDSGCQQTASYENASRGGDRNVLQQWDTLQLTLGGTSYALRMGAWAPEEAPDQETIWLEFGETPAS